jgi:hypothetical protein
MIYCDEGGPELTALMGVTDGIDPKETSDVVDVDLSEEQAAIATRAFDEYRVKVAGAMADLNAAINAINAASAAYRAATAAWLQPAWEDGVQAELDREEAEWKAKADAEWKARCERIAAEDAELGQRLFVQVERPVHERKRYAWGDPARWRIHVKGCRHAQDVTRNNADGIRMDDACGLYLGGALACGRCKSDDTMAADPVNGEKIRTERSVRESKLVNVTLDQLKKTITGVPWCRYNRDGLVFMSPTTFDVQPGYAVVGWREIDDKYATFIPDEYREAVFQQAASRKGWAVWWNTQPGREGYLIVRAKTKAEIRREKEAK